MTHKILIIVMKTKNKLSPFEYALMQLFMCSIIIMMIVVAVKLFKSTSIVLEYEKFTISELLEVETVTSYKKGVKSIQLKLSLSPDSSEYFHYRSSGNYSDIVDRIHVEQVVKVYFRSKHSNSVPYEYEILQLESTNGDIIISKDELENKNTIGFVISIVGAIVFLFLWVLIFKKYELCWERKAFSKPSY